MEYNNVVVSATPHIRSKDSIEGIMKDVCIALLPATGAAVNAFGLRAFIIILISVLSCVTAEYLYQKGIKTTITINDFSAVVTGLLLAYNMPVSAPLWIPVVGGFFAIIVAKQLFGGLGQNFINPALAARAFLLTSYTKEMTNWVLPIGLHTDLETYATPLGILKENPNFIPTTQDFIQALIGNIGGCLGETGALAILIGGLYLIYKKVITPYIPVSFLATVIGFSYLFGRNGIYEILIGGVMLGAFFMATDYSSSPVAKTGQILMGIGCGFITTIIRNFGSYPEGVSYAILLMNLCVPLIDRYIRPKVFGEVKKS